MKAVNPYLNFAGNTEEVFRFYQTVFGGDLSVVRYGDFPDNPMGVPDEDLDKIAHVALPLTNGSMLMGTDTLASHGRELTRGNNFSITLEVESTEEAEELFDALADGGDVMMPLSETEWAEKHGMCTDRFGIRWMLNYTGAKEFQGGAR